MTNGFAIQTDARIDRYGSEHVADVRHGGALRIVDSSTGEQVAWYRAARWTIRVGCGIAAASAHRR